MNLINAEGLDFSELNRAIRECGGECSIRGCLGQRFIASGMNCGTINIDGIPGNALGAYLSGGRITVNGNAQDAVGDTMNDGEIIIHGSVGDAAGYAMRGGEIFVKGSAGYRAGIHMKEYEEKKPALVIGGRAGSFLGEYQAGGVIIVLGLDIGEMPIVGNFPCTGMYGGKMILRGDASHIKFPVKTDVSAATDGDIAEIAPYIKKYCELFGAGYDEIISGGFTVVTPDSKNPYKQMYVAN